MADLCSDWSASIKLGSDWLTCADASDGVCAGLEPQVARQGGDCGHEADDQGVGLDHLDRLIMIMMTIMMMMIMMLMAGMKLMIRVYHLSGGE